MPVAASGGPAFFRAGRGTQLPQGKERAMNVAECAARWRGLAQAVSERLGRPVGVSLVRWRCDNSGLTLGTRVGSMLLFGRDEIEAVVRLVQGCRR